LTSECLAELHPEIGVGVSVLRSVGVGVQMYYFFLNLRRRNF